MRILNEAIVDEEVRIMKEKTVKLVRGEDIRESWEKEEDLWDYNWTGLFIQTARQISNGRKIARIALLWTKIC